MRRVLVAIALLALLPAAPAAAAAGCPEQFAGGAEAALVNPRLATRARELCFQAYAVLHSGVTRTPLWSAEHLTAERVDSARSVQRTNLFHPEDRLPVGERSELADYARSGFDRDHTSPSGDMPDADRQAESFSLANMVPQAHRLNMGLWSSIESKVRALARRDGDVYVVTGPVFQGSELQTLRGRVVVPTAVFKAVSIAQLRDLTGIDVFPALPEAVKTAAPQLPEPCARRGRRPPS
jgi:endonuclease G